MRIGLEVAYELAPSSVQASEFRALPKPYIAAAAGKAHLATSSRSPRASTPKLDLKAVRKRAVASGHATSFRGAVSSEVRQAYAAVQ